MIANILGWILMVVIAVALGWLSWRARRVQNVVLKWIGLLVGGVITLVVALASIIVLVGLFKSYTPRQAEIPTLSVAGTPEQIQRGEHLANSFCASCHSTSNALPLTGGVDLGKDFPMPLGSYVSVNLTPAGPLQNWSDGEIFRALRNGIDKDGRWLAIMSSARGRHLSDEDLQAVIAYLRSQPATPNLTPDPSDQPNLLAIAMVGAGMIPQGEPPINGVISAPPKGPSVEYGEYILSYQDCRQCHGEDLRGGVEGQLAPLGPNLGAVKGWTQEQFITAMRAGKTPSGYTLDSQMPWRNIGRMDDEELTAIYAYLTSIP